MSDIIFPWSEKDGIQFHTFLEENLLPNIEFENQRILTPVDLCYKMLNQNEIIDVCGKESSRILVVNNVEFVWVLNQMDLDVSKVWFSSDSKVKNDFVRKVYPESTIVEDTILVWETSLKFDVIVGNPPYSKGSQNGNPLYHRFVNISMDLLNDNGLLIFISPKSWIGSTIKNNKYDYSGFYDNDILELHLWDINFRKQYFDIGIDVCWYIIQKSNNGTATKITSYVNGSKEEFTACIKPDGRSFPLIVNSTTIDIHKKICKKPQMNFSIYDGARNDFVGYEMIRNGLLSDKKTNEYKYPFLISNSKIMYSKTKQHSFDKYRVGLYEQQKTNKAFIIYKQNTNASIYYKICKNEHEANNLIQILNSKFFLYIDCNYGFGVDRQRIIRKILPDIDYTHSWTDEEIYRDFDLTKEEIKYIEEFTI